MVYSLKLPPQLAKQWAVKIRDRERVEPPHVTILRGRRAWRQDLRTGKFMDEEPDPNEVPEDLLKEVKDNWDVLCTTWDEMYPENRVHSEEDDDE